MRDAIEKRLRRAQRWVSEHRWSVALTLVVALFFLLRQSPVRAASVEEIMTAIWEVESGGSLNPPDGDGGRAIGPFQIHEIYWKDAVAADPSLGPEAGYRYRDCRDPDYARRVIEAYMKRWIPEAWARCDAETIARTHNGGPKGAQKTATDRYWKLVRAELD